MKSQTLIHDKSFTMLPLENFGTLQQRYQNMRLSHRAVTVLEDARPALQMIDVMLINLAKNPKIHVAFEMLRQNEALLLKMRESDAKQAIVSSTMNFISATQTKLANWRRTMERIASGEDVVNDTQNDYIPGHLPTADAIHKLNEINGYLSIIQLVLANLAQLDPEHKHLYESNAIKLRRCTIFLSDCELASSIETLIH